MTDALETLGRDGVRNLAAEIDRHSQSAGFAWSPRPEGGYADSPAFDTDAETYALVIRGYDAALGLVYAKRPSLADVFDAVQRHRQLL